MGSTGPTVSDTGFVSRERRNKSLSILPQVVEGGGAELVARACPEDGSSASRATRRQERCPTPPFRSSTAAEPRRAFLEERLDPLAEVLGLRRRLLELRLELELLVERRRTRRVVEQL